ncbi:flavodoxin domain-containing protein [Clostridium psychrophilum]|uniref:flavodoxin domain-containing protein n=1 Tax=Clostridium psychrophilum TaxID=132926 RepID=UPI001C0BF495|nr:flavodoxin domain-containing protein [Clostridium psychrophilum]MBU3182765.1 flavodoxin domain-containing protein [Clostridium psychrophilum]
MRTVVIYKSKTGFTKKYAEWISEALSADIFDASKADIDVVKAYDIVIYGGSLYAVGIIGVKYITQNLDKLKGKKVVVFATGASPSSEEVISEVRDKNFTPEEQKQLQFFYLRGGFDYSKINPFDKALMTLLKWTIKMKKELTPEARGMLSMYDKPVDFTRKKNIDQIITYVNS